MAMLDNCARIDPPAAGTEKEMLASFLDWHRSTLRCKLAGLTDEQLRQPHIPSGMSLLGLTKHIADVERSWWRECFAGEDLADLWDPDDPNRYWRIEPDETTADVLAFSDGEAEKARAILAAADLDDLARGADPGQEGLTLRWIAFHMLEELARHNGHADFIRESIDGAVGE